VACSSCRNGRVLFGLNACTLERVVRRVCLSLLSVSLHQVQPTGQTVKNYKRQRKPKQGGSGCRRSSTWCLSTNTNYTTQSPPTKYFFNVQLTQETTQSRTQTKSNRARLTCPPYQPHRFSGAQLNHQEHKILRRHAHVPGLVREAKEPGVILAADE
jgi:hypothetical protein